MNSRLQPGPTPLYVQLSSILRSKITSREWPDGLDIATLDELSSQYQVSRVTVRHATQALVNEGLLSSGRGRKTFVTYQPAPPAGSVTPVFPATASAGKTGKFSSTLSRPIEVASLPSGAFGGRAPGHYVQLIKVDFIGGEPYVYTNMFVAAAVFAKLPARAVSRASLANLACDYADPPVTSGRERLQVGAADFQDANHLKCVMAAPIARVKRIFVNTDGDIVYFAIKTYRCDSFEVERDLPVATKSDVATA